MAFGRVTLTTIFNNSAAFSPLDPNGSCLVCCCCFAVTVDEQPVMQIPKSPKFSKQNPTKEKEREKKEPSKTNNDTTTKIDLQAYLSELSHGNNEQNVTP
jgi:hypothetical protein